MLNCYEAFKMLYYSLDYIWDETKDENLGEFCSNMNPFLWKGENSADPAVYSHFKKLFNEKFNDECSYEEAYNFSKEYLKKEVDIYAKYGLEAFEKISLENWKNACENRD